MPSTSYRISTVNQAALNRFLTLPDNAGDDLKGIVANLKKNEAKHPFLVQAIIANGIPEWKSTISGRNLFASKDTRSTTASLPSTNGAPIYFIPLIDSNSNEIKSFLFCAKVGDSSYKYRMYNKEKILHETPNSIGSLSNGITLLGIFATFEQVMHNQNKIVYTYPWTTVYQNAYIRFDNGISASNNRVNATAIGNPLQQKKANSDCWILRSQTITFGFSSYGSVSFEMVWRENICTGQAEFINIFPIGGDGGSVGTGGGSGGSSGGSGDYGGGYGGGGIGGDPGGDYGYGGGAGGGSGGPYIDPFNPPSSIFDPIFGSPVGGVQDPNFGDISISPVFYNQFLTLKEGPDGDPYDANYWDDPNLTMPAQTLPSWSLFQSAYPGHKNPLYDTPEKMYQSVGGTVLAMYNSSPGNYQNTCALRVSKALNYSGITIGPGPGRFQGADGKYYFLGASTLAAWLKLTFGTPTGSNHLTGAQGGAGGTYFPGLVSGKKGIYVMLPVNQGCSGGFCASGHVDIINNGICDGGCYFGAEGGVQDIFIWELP